MVAGALLVIPVRINRSGPYESMVDTGSQLNVIDSLLAAELGLKSQGAVGLIATATYSQCIPCGARMPFGQQPSHLFRDNDGIYEDEVGRFLVRAGIAEVKTAHGGTLRRELFDHVVVLKCKQAFQVFFRGVTVQSLMMRPSPLVIPFTLFLTPNLNRWPMRVV